MKIIDAHCHTSFWTRSDFKKYETINKGMQFTKEGLLNEMKKNNVVHIVTPTSTRIDKGLLEEKYFDKLKDDKFSILAGINPVGINKSILKKADEYLENGTIKGFKLYLGYYHVGPNHKAYHPFFKLAQKHDVPVLMHTGDTFYKTAKLKYSHPLEVDDVAVDFPDNKFVIAHLGYPWTIDAAEVIYKNDNIFVDLSGFVLGNKFPVSLAPKIKEAYLYVSNPNKFMFGTDWPLAPMKEYIEYMKTVIPSIDHNKFFFENAKKVYNIKKC
jgi:predicted TIM-barrel fold metal-dependent hydrolase